MHSSHRTRWTAALLLLLVVGAGLAGCGQKGPLFMPPPEAEPAGQDEDGEQTSSQPATGG